KPDIALGERRLDLRQLLELAGDLDPLHGRAAGELALPAQPGGQRERAVRLVLARPVEAPHAGGEDGLEWVNAGFADLDESFAEHLAIGLVNPGRHGLDTNPQLLDGSLEMPISGAAKDLCHGHALSLNQGCDSCLSLTQGDARFAIGTRVTWFGARQAAVANGGYGRPMAACPDCQREMLLAPSCVADFAVVTKGR